MIEIAIVLAIISLLLGGVLKGQELIRSARVRSLITQQDGIKAAFFGFQDRFRAAPGDYSSAAVTLRCPSGNSCLNGNGNGVIESTAGPVMAGAVLSEVHEDLLVWMHLATAGFLNGSFTMQPGEAAATDTNSPKNPFNIFLQLVYDANYFGAEAPVNRHNLKTGAQVPVEIIAEMDRKIDDGNGARGGFRYSVFSGNAPAAPPAPAAPFSPTQCLNPAGTWYVPEGEVNCGGASLM